LKERQKKPNLQLSKMKPIKKVSDKRTLENIIYKSERIKFLQLPENKKCFIEGINGSGKSVLLKLICGFSIPDEGKIKVNDYEIGKDFDFIQNAGICINSPEFFENLSGMDNLLEIAKIKKIVTEDKIYQFCKLFELDEDIEKKYKYYSLGMRQKLRIIQAIMEEPKILILDEPFDALDKKSNETLKVYLDDFIKKSGHFLIYTSHTKEYKDFADIIYSIEGRNVKRDI
ncbi:MAG: ATP-binding cassette domain-containing protein, partial [Blautia wexlerae]